MDTKEIIFGLVCPILGCLVAAAMFAAPIDDLRGALARQSLGDLNPLPWAVMTGNCLGWCAYAYYTRDPFILAANLPGFVLSLWLNVGASKLQYLHLALQLKKNSNSTSHQSSAIMKASNGFDVESQKTSRASPSSSYFAGSSTVPSASNPVVSSHLAFTTQETWWLRILMGWGVALVTIGWVLPTLLGWPPVSSFQVPAASPQASLVGLLVNLNLIFFYGAPLQSMQQVFKTGTSNSIHVPTVIMGIANASFWFLYGVALWDFIVMVPNAIGLALALGQAGLCWVYPRGSTTNVTGRLEEVTLEVGSVQRFHDEPVTSAGSNATLYS